MKDGKRKEEEGKHTDGVERDELGDLTLSLFSHMLIYTVITGTRMFVSYKCIHQVNTSCNLPLSPGSVFSIFSLFYQNKFLL